MKNANMFDYHHARPTPWGKADSVNDLGLGFVLVGTPGHGGIMIGCRQAEKVLSEAAQKRGQVFNQFLCYEEDCDISIVIFEYPQLWVDYRASWADKIISAQETKQSALESLSRWHAEYLIERGITPEGDQYREYLFRKEDQKLRDNKDPRLIVSASMVKDHDGQTAVCCADGLNYIVEGYTYPRPNFQHNLLDFCKVLQRV